MHWYRTTAVINLDSTRTSINYEEGLIQIGAKILINNVEVKILYILQYSSKSHWKCIWTRWPMHYI
jgi:hypothetical protein